MKIFVYGTLKIDERNHELFSNGMKYIGEGTTIEKFGGFVCHGIPYVFRFQNGKRVFGEIFEIDDKLISDLDKFEYQYNRESVYIEDDHSHVIECEMYIYDLFDDMDTYINLTDEWEF